MNFAKDEYMNSLVQDLKRQVNEVVESALGEGIKKGYISVKQGNLVLVQDPMKEGIKLYHHVVIDYLGAEKIEELETENAYLKKINGTLHESLSDFYEKTKVNQWLKKN